MNERDYFILELIFLCISLLYFIIGLFLIQVINMDTFLNRSLLLTVFLSCFILAVYFRYKRHKIQDEILKEIREYKELLQNEFNNQKNP